MARSAGRKQFIRKGGVTIAGVRVTGMKFGDTPIDVTDNDSAALQVLLADSGGRVLTLSVSGVETDGIFRDLALDNAQSKLITDLSFVFGDALAAVNVLTGNFYMTDYEEPAEYQVAVMFTANFTSSGPWARN